MVRPPTTSRRTSKHSTPGSNSLRELIAALPAERAAAVFTHSSWAADRAASYERLEFLGDSVLELAIARTLFDRFPEFSEGRMAKIRSHVVSRASCAIVARDLQLGERLLAESESQPPAEVTRLSENRNVLAAVLEAALAALYLEHGFEPIAKAIVGAFEPHIEFALTSQFDHKTDLQERLARTGRGVNYIVLEVAGPPHDRMFTAAAVIESQIVGTGSGRSKKDAEQGAARQALAISAAADDAAPASAPME